MANKKTLVDNTGGGPGVWTVSLDTTGTVHVGEAASGAVGSWELQVSGTFSGSLVLKKRVVGSLPANVTATYYFNDAAGSTEVAAGTAITAAGLFKVPCDGCVLSLDYTATSGTMIVECVNLLG